MTVDELCLAWLSLHGTLRWLNTSLVLAEFIADLVHFGIKNPELVLYTEALEQFLEDALC